MAIQIRLCSHNFTPFSVYLLIILLFDAIMFGVTDTVVKFTRNKYSFMYRFVSSVTELVGQLVT
jgi:hypothetical protein